MKRSKTEAHVFTDATLREGRGTRLAIAFVILLVAAVAMAMVAMPDMRIALGIFSFLITPPLAFGIIQLRDNMPRGGGPVEIGTAGVFVDGQMALPRETLIRAVVTRDERGVIVSIERKGGFTAVIDVQNEEQGRRLVKALGLGASQTLSEFVFDSPVAAKLPRPLLALYLVALGAGVLVPLFYRIPWLSLFLGIAGYSVLIAMMVPAKLTVGLDGLSVRWAGQRQFIRFSELKSVDHDGNRLRLELEGDRQRFLSVQWTGDRFTTPGVVDAGFPSREAYLDAIVARIREAMAASDGAVESAALRALRRGDRDVRAWIRGLQAILDRGAAGFRAAETVPETLWNTVEDGRAEPVDRAAAAIALAPTLDEEDRHRLRGVSRVVVSPKLRIALEAAVENDEAAVAEALAALEQRPVKSRSKRQKSD